MNEDEVLDGSLSYHLSLFVSTFDFFSAVAPGVSAVNSVVNPVASVVVSLLNPVASAVNSAGESSSFGSRFSIYSVSKLISSFAYLPFSSLFLHQSSTQLLLLSTTIHSTASFLK